MYENVSYNSVVMKNVFHDDDEADEPETNEKTELFINDFAYMPSIEFKFMGEEKDILDLYNDPTAVWTESFEFDEKNIRYP